MAAVIGVSSLVLVVIALVTTASLGQSLESQLERRVSEYSDAVTQQLVAPLPQSGASVDNVLRGRSLEPGYLVAVSSELGGTSGVVFERGRDQLGGSANYLTSQQLHQIEAARNEAPSAIVAIEDLGSYRVVATTAPNGVNVVIGFPRTEIQAQLTKLISVIVLTTIGGLLLLAVCAATTIRLTLRPLRSVAETAGRVANQPMDRGAVEITERVPDAQADPRTETGLVGASLNKLLDHVNTSLIARQNNESKMRRFVADASHELRTPLASIRGYSELSLRALERQSAPTALEATSDSLKRIHAQSIRMTRLVEDLLLLARLDEGAELVYDVIDLVQIGLEGITDARVTDSSHDWAVEVPDGPVRIRGDAARMHQVVANLLSNARTHTPAGTQITLSVSQADGDAVLRVSDNGPGIDPSVREELFARFARGDSSRARQTGGTGLGLAITKAIVEGHDGSITASSSPGITSFIVRVPIASD